MAFVKQRTILLAANPSGGVSKTIVVDGGGRMTGIDGSTIQLIRKVQIPSPPISVMKDEDDSDVDGDSDSDGSGGSEVTATGGPRKRRRLTNLTPQEKMTRRKLKNRVAAQTARDRKKARMSELEEALAKMEAENKKLLAENANLKQCTSTLSSENNRLKERLVCASSPLTTGVSSAISSRTTTQNILSSCAPLCPTNATRIVETGKQSEPVPESAVLSPPQQQERARTVVPLVNVQWLLSVLLTIGIAQCLSCWSALMSSSGSLERSSTTRRQIKMEPISEEDLTPSSSLHPTNPALPPWWGAHQRNWTPSMS